MQENYYLTERQASKYFQISERTLGRESKPQKNIPFIKIYDDGTVEKKITID